MARKRLRYEKTSKDEFDRLNALIKMWALFQHVLLLQLSYKVTCFLGVIIPILAAGKFPTYGILHVVIFASYIIGDLVVIPFSYPFSKVASAEPALT